jgi:hypothetical protein
MGMLDLRHILELTKGISETRDGADAASDTPALVGCHGEHPVASGAAATSNHWRVALPRVSGGNPLRPTLSSLRANGTISGEPAPLPAAM